MNRKTMTLVAILPLLMAGSAHAVDWSEIFQFRWCLPNCSQPACPDDYCPKSMPCPPQVRCFSGDDYVPKRAPCVEQYGRCGEFTFMRDDYRPKCPPRFHCSPREALTCVGTDGCCGEGVFFSRDRGCRDCRRGGHAGDGESSP